MKEKILEILSSNLELSLADHEAVIDKRHIQSWDSIRTLMIITDLESEFNISFTPEEIEKVDSFYSIYELVKEKAIEN